MPAGGRAYGRDAPTAAVVLAGGSGSRVGAAGNKVYLPVAGRPLLSWALAAFAAAPSVRRLVLVARPADLDLARDAADRVERRRGDRPRRRDPARLGVGGAAPAGAGDPGR